MIQLLALAQEAPSIFSSSFWPASNKGVVSSSLATEALLKNHHIPVLSLNSANELPVYVDGADEATKD